MNDTMIVSGKRVRLKPYTERRFKSLIGIIEEIDAYCEANDKLRFMDIDRETKGKFWKRKGDILWECDEPLDMDFYKSEDFESSQLKKAQDFFLQNGLFL